MRTMPEEMRGLTVWQRREEAWQRIEAAERLLTAIGPDRDSNANRALLEGAVKLLVQAGRYLEAV